MKPSSNAYVTRMEFAQRTAPSAYAVDHESVKHSRLRKISVTLSADHAASAGTRLPVGMAEQLVRRDMRWRMRTPFPREPDVRRLDPE
jgi:hypothetical protein